MRSKSLNYLLMFFLMSTMLVIKPNDAAARRVGGWEKLGERTVNLSLDRDVVDCLHKGAFTAIRFNVGKAPVNFYRVVVKYANGALDDLKFNELVRAGDKSKILDLRGNRRIIKQITLYYKAEPKAKGRNHKHRMASVQIWGKHY